MHATAVLVYSLLAALLWGVSPLFAKHVVNGLDRSPVAITLLLAWTSLLSFFVFAAIALFQQGAAGAGTASSLCDAWAAVRGADSRFLWAWVLASYVVAPLLYYRILSAPTIQTYWLVAATSVYPVVTAAVSALVLKQVPPLRHWIAIASIVTGCVLLSV